MSVRSWAVGVVSTAAVVAGVVAVQSGISGIAALPVLPHRTVAPSAPAGGAELPVPAEVSAPSPGAGTVHEAPVAGVELVAEQPAAADRPAKRIRQSAEDGDGGSGKPDGRDGSGRGPGRDSGKGSGSDSGRDRGGGPGRG